MSNNGSLDEFTMGPAIRKMRLAKGLSAAKAASELGCSQSTISNIENRVYAISPALIQRIEDAWGINVYILCWCAYGDLSRLPEGCRESMRELTEIWRNEIESWQKIEW